MTEELEGSPLAFEVSALSRDRRAEIIAGRDRFNMADQLVTGPACTMLCQAYDGTGDHAFGGCSKAELEELGREIVG